MNYILDTHVVLWMVLDSEKLPNTIREIVSDNSNHKFVSIATLWEISIKNRIDKLPLPQGLSAIFSEVEALGIGIFGVERNHIKTYNKLPLLHRDPFDGIIIATALCENATIITADKNIQKYDVSWFWQQEAKDAEKN